MSLHSYKLVEADGDWFRNVVDCQAACPAHTAVPQYIRAILERDPGKAYEINQRANLLPGILGRVCNHPCEKVCRRSRFDAPVSICALKRFAADNTPGPKEEAGPDKGPASADKLKRLDSRTKGSVAILGGGPVGLTVAYDLVRRGVRVVVFEASSVLGGMLYLGIPEYRLPRDVIAKELDSLLAHGIEVRMSQPVGREEDFKKLMQDFDAILVAVGAHKGLKLNIPGEDEFDGFLDCIDFLRDVNLGQKVNPGDRIVVIGGGNSAIDSARTAVRLAVEGGSMADEIVLQAADTARSALRIGSSHVTILYRRSREEMPANAWEIDEAEIEGVDINYLTAPVRVLGEGGRIRGMECIRMKLGEPDDSGRRRPVKIEGSEFQIPCDVVISAISQEADFSFFPEDLGIEKDRWGTPVVDSETLATSVPGIFAAGDAVTGPRTVIEAISAGHKAAESIYRHIEKKEMKGGRDRMLHNIQEARPPRLHRSYHLIPRQHMETLDVTDRMKEFQEVELGLTESEAIREASRCLQCDHNIFLDASKCILCGGCIDVCPENCINMVRAEHVEGDNKILDDAGAWPEGAVAMMLDENRCIRCANCVNRCPTGAITMKKYELAEVKY